MVSTENSFINVNCGYSDCFAFKSLNYSNFSNCVFKNMNVSSQNHISHSIITLSNIKTINMDTNIFVGVFASATAEFFNVFQCNLVLTNIVANNIYQSD